MKSPRFDIRIKKLRTIFRASNIERIWKDKVRISLRNQFLNDGIENLDFHVYRESESKKLSQLILTGSYVPQKAQRILVEKSKGLCRQIVIPSVKDALVLQCLSDALYLQIKDKSPTDRAFFEPEDHKFSSSRSGYGTFAAWLNFQRELFNFSKNRKFIVVTDIANYYDTISYAHLRNVISSVTGAEECILDMLIYVLSDLLWQPDYTPRVEVGLPQMELDAPRLLAHCFLYELDSFIASNPGRDFVRFMDDIDIGVDSIVDAKLALRAVDLVLQTKQIRLNAGKTVISSSDDALKYFYVRENAQLDFLRDYIERRSKIGLPLERARTLIEKKISKGLHKGHFDLGNGEKVLKRWIGLASKTGGRIKSRDLARLLRLRPGIRETVLLYMRQFPLTPAYAQVLVDFVRSGMVVDDASIVRLSNDLVETLVKQRYRRHDKIEDIILSFDGKSFYDFYCMIWLQSKYYMPQELLSSIKKFSSTWVAQEALGRIVGAFQPIFENGPHRDEFLKIVVTSRNKGCRETYLFQRRLGQEDALFKKNVRCA